MLRASGPVKLTHYLVAGLLALVGIILLVPVRTHRAGRAVLIGVPVLTAAYFAPMPPRLAAQVVGVFHLWPWREYLVSTSPSSSLPVGLFAVMAFGVLWILWLIGAKLRA